MFLPSDCVNQALVQMLGRRGRYTEMSKADICTQIVHELTDSKNEGKYITRTITLNSMKASIVPLLLFLTIILPKSKLLSG